MKKTWKTLAAFLLIAVLTVGMLTACAPSETQHACKHVCEICGLCTDLTCTDPVCENKCQGHNEPETHSCVKKCPVCGKCVDMECEEPECSPKCGDQHEGRYVFEAEDPHVILQGGERGNLRIMRETAYGAEDTYIGNFNANVGAAITFTINVEKATTATLFVSACKRTQPSIFTNNVAVLINKTTMIDSPSPVPVNGRAEDTWTEFTDVNLGCVTLNKGENEVRLAIMDAGVQAGYNINNISFKSSAEITFYEGPHTCKSQCLDCGKCTDYSCTDPVCADKCEEGWDTYDFSALDSHVSASNTETDAENSALILRGGSGAKVAFDFRAESAGYAVLYAEVLKLETDTAVSDLLSINVNGIAFATQTSVSVAGDEQFTLVRIGYAYLRSKRNSIEFVVKSSDVVLRSLVVKTDENKLEYIEFMSNYIYEAEDADSNGWANNSFWKTSNAGASGGMHVGHINDVAGQGYYFSLTLNAAEAADVTLYLGLGTPMPINASAFPITVNDDDPIIVNKTIEQTDWEVFAEVEITTLSLQKGKNVIKIEIAGGALCNLDYIGIESDVELTRLPADAEPELPPKEEPEIEGYIFEAENAASNGFDDGQLSKENGASASGGKYVGRVFDVAGKGYYLTFTVYAADDTEAVLSLGIGAAANINASAFPFSVNGGDRVTVDKAITMTDWTVFAQVEFATVSLRKGINTITVYIEEGAAANLDYLALQSTVLLSSTEIN